MSESDIQSGSLSLSVKKSIDFVKIRWETYWEYLFFTIGCTLQCNSFLTFIADPKKGEVPTLIHFMICFVCVGLPVLYMQLVIGQFTQLGPVHFKYINPLTHGIGYMFMINTGIKCIRFGLQLADFYLYLLMSLARILEWTKCPANTNLKCWDASKVEQKNYAIEPDTELSAYIFWKLTYMQNVKEHISLEGDYEPNFYRCVTSAVVWFLTYLLLVYGAHHLKKVVKLNVYVIDICLICMIVVALFHSGAIPELNQMFLSKFNQFMSIRMWYICINYLLELLAMGRGIHILCGNMLNPSANTSIISIGCILTTIVHTFAASLVTNLAIGIISYNANLENNHHTELIRSNYTAAWFVILPQALGLVATPQLWTIIYFFMCVLILTNNQLTHLFVMERCIMDAYPRLIKYRRYLLAIVCLLYFLCTIPLTSQTIFPLSIFLTGVLRPDMELFTVTIMVLCVSYIYGVQRLSDDIHFFLGSQPAKFWKVCWYSIPVLLMVTFIHVLSVELDTLSENFQIGQIIFISLYLLPIPISFIVEFFRHLRDHNLIGLFKPNERWGPADPEERHLRKIFNPREEIRSRRRKDTCPHNCLINSKVIKKILDEERQKRKEEFGVD